MRDKVIMLSGEVQYPVTVENPHELVDSFSDEEFTQDEESKVNLEFEKYIEEQKQKLRSLIRF